MTSALPMGALGMLLGGALTNFPCKLRLNFFPPPLGVKVHPLHPLAMFMCLNLAQLTDTTGWSQKWHSFLVRLNFIKY